MKRLTTLLLVVLGFAANAQTTITPGTKAPDFNLKNVDGKNVSFKSMGPAKGYIVVFTCNTCPYAKAYEQRIIDLNTKYAPLGYPVIAINPNDPAASPSDSYEKMAELAKNKNYTFPYLFDEGQTVTNAYGAKNTPHIFFVKHTNAGNVIAYTGAIDNDTEDSNPDKINYLEQAITAVMDGKEPPVSTTKAIGCTVKRKKA